MKKEMLDNFIIRKEQTVVDALQKIDANAKGIVFVVDENGCLAGTLTDGDIRRWLLKTGDLKGKVESIMNRNPKFVYRKDSKMAMEEMEKYQITALAIVDTKGKIQDIVFRSQSTVEKDEQEQLLKEVPVIIMAGGKGTRLYPYTKILPKPLVPVGDIPIMERIINKFRDFGVKDFYATLNYRKNMIKSYFSEIEADYNISYVEENEPLGTAGSLCLIEKKFDGPVIVTNCDILINEDYNEIYRYHINSGNEMTLVSAIKNIVVPYGVIHSAENGSISSLEEKPKLSYFVNTGMYLLNPEILDEIPKNTFYHMTHLADKLLKEGRKVGMYPVGEDAFLDMGEFEEMHRMEQALSKKSE